MLEVLAAADAAESTIGTMVGTFFGGHPKVADGAVILTELNGTMNACIGIGGLSRVAFATDNFLDGESIDVVMSGRTVVERHGERGASGLFVGFSFVTCRATVIVVVSSLDGTKSICVE